MKQDNDCCNCCCVAALQICNAAW